MPFPYGTLYVSVCEHCVLLGQCDDFYLASFLTVWEVAVPGEAPSCEGLAWVRVLWTLGERKGRREVVMERGRWKRERAKLSQNF